MAMNNILGLFAHSPLKPLQKHSSKVTECCELLIPFFEAIFKTGAVRSNFVLISPHMSAKPMR